MKRIVVVEYAEKWTAGGIESYILNIVKLINKEQFELHIVVSQKETDVYDSELAQCGVKVEALLDCVETNPIKRMVKNRNLLGEYLKANPCDVLHLHICQGVSLRYAKIAKKQGVRQVISHCHSSDFGDGNRILKTIGHKMGKMLYASFPDKLVACSDLAAEWLYTKAAIEHDKVTVWKYLVNVDRFAFSQGQRDKMRKEYELSDDCRVLLNVGRLHYQKNQKFLLHVLRDINEHDKNAKLVLIGDGELKKEIHEYADQLGVTDSVIFIDKTREIPAYMSMADIFVLPSIYEGNPIVGTEAQASGLPCFFSTAITKEAGILSTTKFLGLDEASVIWANSILETHNSTGEERLACVNELKNQGYDIDKQIVAIEGTYQDL